MSLINESFSFSGSVAISKLFQDKSYRHLYVRRFDAIMFPAKGGNALITLTYQNEPYWCVLLNVGDNFISENVIEGQVELDMIIRKIFPERHFMLARANRLVVRYRESRNETEHKVISDKIRIARDLLFSETERLEYKREYDVTFDVLRNHKEEKLIKEELVYSKKSTHLEIIDSEASIENPLDDISLIKRYSKKYNIDSFLYHAIFSRYAIHKSISEYVATYQHKGKEYQKTMRYFGDNHKIQRLDRELTLDDILELSKAYIIVLRHLVIPLRGKELHIHKIAYNGQIFYIYSDAYLFSDVTVFAKRRNIALSEHYKKLFPKILRIDNPNELFDVLEKLRNTRLKFRILSPLEQLYELFYERRPREQKQKYFEYYFELFEKIKQISKGKIRLIISFPRAYRFKVFRISKTKRGYIKVRAVSKQRLPSQIWIRGKFLREYIKSNNLEDYIHFIFKSKREKLAILKKYFRQLYTYLAINPISLSDLDWKTFEGMMNNVLPKIPFLSAIHKYFMLIRDGNLIPQYAKKEEILVAYDRFLFAIKNNKPEKLLESDILKWIRNAVKYYLIMEHNIKPKAGMVLSGDPYEILRKIFEKIKKIEDKELALLMVNSMTELELYSEAIERDKELGELVSRLRMDIIFE